MEQLPYLINIYHYDKDNISLQDRRNNGMFFNQFFWIKLKIIEVRIYDYVCYFFRIHIKQAKLF